MSIFSKNDIFFMECALQQAERAFNVDEVPIGAVAVCNRTGKVVAQAYNEVEKKQSVHAHAEMQLITALSFHSNQWRLQEYTIYVTLQPCMMCLGALLLSRVHRVVFAATSPIYGFSLDRYVIPEIYKQHTIVQEGLLEKEAQGILKKFFKKQRLKKGRDKDE